MTTSRAAIAGGVFVTSLVLLIVAPDAESDRGFLHGRITTIDGATYEGRPRWARDQEALWDDYFAGGGPGYTDAAAAFHGSALFANRGSGHRTQSARSRT
jgi:hypothetical protein